MSNSHLPEVAHIAIMDMDITLRLLRKLMKPLTNANWDQERKLLVRQLGRTSASLKAFEKALEKPAPE